MKMLLIADHDPAALLDIQCVIQRLIQKHRECRISLMAPKGLQSLARRLDGLDDLLTLPDADVPVKIFWSAGRQLEDWQKEFVPFDQALVFTRRWKPALVPWMAGVARRSGQLGRFRFMLINDARWMSAARFPDRRSRYIALADDHGEMSEEPFQPVLIADADNGRALLQTHDLDPERPGVVFCPGGDLNSAQQWPAERWSVLAGELIDQGWQVWLIAPKTQQAFCEQICRGVDHERQLSLTNLCGRLAWDDKLDLMAISRAVVAQQTLYSRLCLALDHPLVQLQNSGQLRVVLPQDEDHQGNQSSRQRPAEPLIRTEQGSEPCHERACRPYKNRATDPCIHNLSVDRVRSALLSMVPMQATD